MNRKSTTKTNGGAQGAADLEKIAQGKWARWRTTTRKGKRVLVSPDGAHIYHGTAQEVREAALTPERRDALAQSIEWARHTADKFGYTPEQRREYIREKRREAIKTSCLFESFGEDISVPVDVYILLKAGARLVLADGETVNDFFADVFDAALVGILDKAAEVTGKREIPLTRYERAALDRIKREARATA